MALPVLRAWGEGHNACHWWDQCQNTNSARAALLRSLSSVIISLTYIAKTLLNVCFRKA